MLNESKWQEYNRINFDISIKYKESNGYKYIDYEYGIYHFSKKTDNGYFHMKCHKEDFYNGNFEFFALHNLSNENKVKLPKEKRTKAVK